MIKAYVTALCCALPALANSQEVASFCMASAHPQLGMRAHLHFSDGRLLETLGDPRSGQTEIVRQTFAEPITSFLWERTEPVIETLPLVEDPSCAPEYQVSMIVTFEDGTSERRDATCVTAPLVDLLLTLALLAPRDRTELTNDVEILDELIVDGTAACGRDW